MMKVVLLLFLFESVFCLRLGSEICDRGGSFAKQILEGKSNKDSTLDVYEVMETIGDGQSYYSSNGTNGVICFDNWGIYDGDIQFPAVKQDSSGECPVPTADKNGQNMYNFMVTDGLENDALKGKHVLEVGCGRGKGAAYMAQAFHLKSLVGVDLNKDRIALASKSFGKTPNVEFKVGDAMNLPVRDSTMDFIINVESSFHYPDFGKFLSEVYRVLSPGGRFLWTAPLLKRGESFHQKVAAFEAAGFHLTKKQDITQKVVGSRKNHLEQSGSKEFGLLCETLKMDLETDTAFWHWYALPGSMVFDALNSGEIQYIRFVAEKPN